MEMIVLGCILLGASVLSLSIAFVLLSKRVYELEAQSPKIVKPSWRGLSDCIVRVKRPEVVGLVATEDGEVLLSDIEVFIPEGQLENTRPIRANNAIAAYPPRKVVVGATC